MLFHLLNFCLCIQPLHLCSVLSAQAAASFPAKALGEERENSPGAKKLQPRALKLAEDQRQEARSCNGKGWAVLIANSITGFARKTTARAAWLHHCRVQTCLKRAGAHSGCSQGLEKQLLDVFPQEPKHTMEQGKAELSFLRERSCRAPFGKASCAANPAPAKALCGGRQVGFAGLLVSMWG